MLNSNAEFDEFEEADVVIAARFAASASSTMIHGSDEYSYNSDNGVTCTSRVELLDSSLSFLIKSCAYGVGGCTKRGIGTGMKFWSEGAKIAANFLIGNIEIVRGKSVVELGCGSSGLPGLTAAALGARCIDFVDSDADSLGQLEENIAKNLSHIKAHNTTITASELTISHKDWAELALSCRKYDLAIGCEIVYTSISIEDLVLAINSTLAAEGNSNR